MGEFGLIVFNQKMMEIWKFRKGPGIYLCCHNYECYSSMVAEGGKAAVGGYWGEVMKEPHHVPPVTGTDERMNDVTDE